MRRISYCEYPPWSYFYEVMEGMQERPEVRFPDIQSTTGAASATLRCPEDQVRPEEVVRMQQGLNDERFARRPSQGYAGGRSLAQGGSNPLAFMADDLGGSSQ